MTDNFEDVTIISKDLLKQIISTLKTLDVRGFDSMDALVGCVMVLEKALIGPEKPVNDENLDKGENDG